VSTRNNPLAKRKFPLLCYVTDRRALPEVNPSQPLAALTRTIAEVVAAGIDWVQLREKDLPAAELASLTGQCLKIAAKLSANRSGATRIMVNDRLDVAIAERANGIHLGEKSLPVTEARRLVASALRNQHIDPSFLVGVSCHSIEAAAAAQRDGADYIFFGPIFPTPSKENFGPPQGLKRLEQVCRAVSIPVLAIGGITLDNAASCILAGATGIAAIRFFQDALDLTNRVELLHRRTTDSRP
jgi:thiamine-phosphate pyrophosphorylase